MSAETPAIVVESWRFIPHSYALINMHLLAQWAGRGDVRVFHRDLPYVNARWQPERGVLPAEDEARIAAVPAPPPGLKPTAVLRLSFPYRLEGSAAGRTFVFGTCEHGTIPNDYVEANCPLERALQGHAAQIVTCTKWGVDGFLRSGARAARVHNMPLGVDARRYRPPTEAERAEARRKLNAGSDFVVLHVGAMTGNKNPALLMSAFAQLLTRRPNCRLVFKGTDALYQSKGLLSNAVMNLPEADRARLMPRMAYIGHTLRAEEMVELYWASDALAAPYSAEGFCLPALEAMACGLPVVVTDGGPTDDFVPAQAGLKIGSKLRRYEGKNAFYLAVDPASVVNQLQRVVDDATFRQQAREAGPAHVAAGWTWPLVADKWLRMLLEAPLGA